MRRVIVMMMCALIVMTSVAWAALAQATQAISAGDTGEAVQKMQSRLIELGFLEGNADGDYGKKTQTAVEAFEQYLIEQGANATADGAMDAREQDWLYGDEYAVRRLNVQLGDKGALVTKLQKRLQRLGFFLDGVDGVFGKKTQSALTSFQQMLVDAGEDEITVNGVADESTRRFLYSTDLSEYEISTPQTYDPDDPISLKPTQLYASAYILVDANTGKTLMQHNAGARMYPASTTKIMTLLLAVEYGHLDDMVTVPKTADEVPWDSSRVPVYTGEKMPFKDLLYGLMIKSGNDAANAIATIVSGSIDAFAAKMNERAREIGMEDTHFVNPHGYHSAEHYTTAYDMARLTAVALNNATFREIVQTKTYTMSATKLRKSLTLNNGYAILNSASTYYYPYAFGVKTGYTSKAGQCYVGAAIKGKQKLIAVVLDSRLDKYNKYVDAKRLFEYGFARLDA